MTELSDRLAPFNYHFGRLNNADDVAHMGKQINIVIREFILEKGGIFDQTQTNKSDAFVTNKSKNLQAARTQKKILKKRAVPCLHDTISSTGDGNYHQFEILFSQ